MKLTYGLTWILRSWNIYSLYCLNKLISRSLMKTRKPLFFLNIDIVYSYSVYYLVQVKVKKVTLNSNAKMIMFTQKETEESSCQPSFLGPPTQWYYEHSFNYKKKDILTLILVKKLYITKTQGVYFIRWNDFPKPLEVQRFM